MLARLQQAFEQQVRFTADASHELRTPISVLIAHAELALARTRSASDYEATVATCLRAGERMKSLVEDLLVLARADAGKLELRMLPVDLGQIAEEATQMLRPIAEQRDVKLVLDCLPAECLGDADRLLQVTTNLISNAIQYNRSGGEVHVKTSVVGPHAVMEVRDTGVGIAAANLPHLFERFYRVDEARSRDSGGSGLGLAICQSILEAHRGSIAAASEVGMGSVFEIRIPRGESLAGFIENRRELDQRII
jgi:signal transduction histidine kinase